MRGDYLFYEEKVETTQEEKDAKAARRQVSSSSSRCQDNFLVLIEPVVPQILALS